MSAFRDITGQRFGRLVVVEIHDRVPEGKYQRIRWLCQCDCGEQTIVRGNNLKAGAAQSCGCSKDGNPKPRPAKVCECGDHAWTELTRGFVALVSPEDADLFNTRAFSAHKAKRTFYARCPPNYLHRLVMPEIEMVDHKNGNGLDCRRENLRSTDDTGNCANKRKTHGVTSQYKGVWQNNRGSWETAVRKGRKVFRWGLFQTELEAAEAYQRWSVEAYGEFASWRV